ncbi:uncharacterized protein LOC117152263 [Bombus impatiens]|uniref:Uncharacterized protein LOC117152263 n=1 Tax=Bombus impatiens TaxID=132113 RepID=A0A6P8L5B9_BOMIM|nr:uncharacterized protein LOC117152263 [Bombus impatiens]
MGYDFLLGFPTFASFQPRIQEGGTKTSVQRVIGRRNSELGKAKGEENDLPHLVSVLDDDWFWQIPEDGDREGSAETKAVENVAGCLQGAKRDDDEGVTRTIIRP